MADKPANKKTEATKEALDLNSLSGLDFGPNWADANAKPARPKQYDSDSRGKRGGGAPRDRRSGGGRSGGGRSGGYSGNRPGGPGGPAGSGGRDPSAGNRGRRDGGDQRGSREGRDGRGFAPKPFEPTVDVDLYPQDEAFEALINRLRSSARTYQLFDIAHLLLEKPDRFIVVVAPKKVKGEDAQLYYSVPGHLPFETEEAAVSHVVANHLDQFFDIEAIEVEPPKGNFLMVNRCTITGELLGPPNYHRYQEFVQRHYAARITGMSFERFTSRIEGVKEQEQIDAWLESMKKGARYTVKDHQESEPESFETVEAARHFLLQHRKDKVVGSGESIRFAGRDIERLPPGDIRRSVEAYVENQKHFPLDSANNIRGRLRRHKFAVYKKGSKGVSFVCAVKRKFRDTKTVFTDSISDLIDFIEKHPDMPASKLPQEYIGIDTEKQKPETLKMTEAEVEAAAKAKAEAAEAAEAEAAEAAEAAESTEALATKAAESSTAQAEPAEPAETTEPAETAGTAEPRPQAETPQAETPQAETPNITEDAKASTEAMPKSDLSKEDEAKLRQLMLDLRWLITEGYVTEYGDGRLFAPPPMPQAKPKPPEIKTSAEPKAKPVEAKKTAGPAEPAEPVEDKKSAEPAVARDGGGADQAVAGASETPEAKPDPKDKPE